MIESIVSGYKVQHNLNERRGSHCYQVGEIRGGWLIVLLLFLAKYPLYVFKFWAAGTLPGLFRGRHGEDYIVFPGTQYVNSIRSCKPGVISDLAGILEVLVRSVDHAQDKHRISRHHTLPLHYSLLVASREQRKCVLVGAFAVHQLSGV